MDKTARSVTGKIKLLNKKKRETMRKIALLLATACSLPLLAFYPAYRNINGVSYKHAVMSIAHDNENIYVSKVDGLVVLNKATGKKVSYSRQLKNFDYAPTALTMNEGTLMIGTTEGVLLTMTDGKVEKYPATLPSNKDINGISVDSKGRIYVCSEGRVYSMNADGYSVAFESFNEWSSAFGLGVMKMDSRDQLWACFISVIGPFIPLIEYTSDGETINVFDSNASLPGSGKSVYSLAIDKDENVWYSYPTALAKIEGDNFKAFECSSTLINMEFDADGTLWATQNNGPLLSFDGKEFQEHPCLLETQQWLCMDIDGDDIFIGTDEGLIRYNNGNYTIVDVDIHSSVSGVNAIEMTQGAQADATYNLAGQQTLGNRPGITVSKGKKILNGRQ